MWLINLPRKDVESKDQKSKIREQKLLYKNQDSEIKNEKTESIKQNTEDKSKRASVSHQSADTSIKSKIELPKLANLESRKIYPEENKETEKKTIQSTINLMANKQVESLNFNLPDITKETRIALAKPEKKLSDIVLRKEISVNKSQYKVKKQIRQKIETNEIEPESEESWIPKYISESKEIIRDIKLNLDQIAENIELTGLINNTGKEQAAIIKNKLNNKTEILKKGDEYQGLKLIDIKPGEIVLENQDINKIYVKKLINNVGIRP